MFVLSSQMWYNIYRSHAGANHYEVTIMPKTMTLKEAQAAYSLSIEASQASQGPIFVEYEGRPVAVIVSIQDYRQRFSTDHDTWRQEQLQRLEPNRTAFQRLLPELLKTHRNRFVAFYQGRLVDADPDRVALVQRTRTQGYRPVYIQKVTPEPRVVELPSPEEVGRVSL